MWRLLWCGSGEVLVWRSPWWRLMTRDCTNVKLVMSPVRSPVWQPTSRFTTQVNWRNQWCNAKCIWTRNWSYIATHLVLLAVGVTLFPNALLFPTGSEWNLPRTFFKRSIDGVWLLIWRHTFKMASVTSFYVILSLWCGFFLSSHILSCRNPITLTFSDHVKSLYDDDDLIWF